MKIPYPDRLDQKKKLKKIERFWKKFILPNSLLHLQLGILPLLPIGQFKHELEDLSNVAFSPAQLHDGYTPVESPPHRKHPFSNIS